MSRQVILNICEQEGVDVRVLSRGWLFRLEKDGKIRYMFNNTLPLNSQSSSAVAADKFATFEALRAANIPVIDHSIIYPFDNHLDFAKGNNTLSYLERYFADHDQDIVIKPNHGLGGRGITHVTSVDQFSVALSAAFAHSESASLCPFYHIRREYRIIMLDDEARLVYGKERSPSDWRFNLQHGATSVDVADPALRARLIALAKRTVTELNLRFCSVDIIELDPAHHHAHSPSQPAPSGSHASITPGQPELLVIEVNGAVSTSHYCAQHPDQLPFIQAIYRDALHKIFA